MHGRWGKAISAPVLPHLRSRCQIGPGASLARKRSRIFSPKLDSKRQKSHPGPRNLGICSAVNANFLPNLLTLGTKHAKNHTRKASPCPSRRPPMLRVSRHHGNLPKILTFYRKKSSGAYSEHPADPHGSHASSRKSSPLGAENTFFARFWASTPEKLHLRSAFFPDPSHPTRFSPSISPKNGANRRSRIRSPLHFP